MGHRTPTQKLVGPDDKSYYCLLPRKATGAESRDLQGWTVKWVECLYLVAYGTFNQTKNKSVHKVSGDSNKEGGGLQESKRSSENPTWDTWDKDCFEE